MATEDQYLGLSGSDLEAVLVRAILEAEAAESSEVKAGAPPEGLLRTSSPPPTPASARCRSSVAVLESTSRELLPERYRTLDRGEIQARVNEIKRELRLI